MGNKWTEQCVIFFTYSFVVFFLFRLFSIFLASRVWNVCFHPPFYNEIFFLLFIDFFFRIWKYRYYWLLFSSVNTLPMSFLFSSVFFFFPPFTSIPTKYRYSWFSFSQFLALLHISLQINLFSLLFLHLLFPFVFSFSIFPLSSFTSISSHYWYS